jgi:hypothetical protein
MLMWRGIQGEVKMKKKLIRDSLKKKIEFISKAIGKTSLIDNLYFSFIPF